MRVASLLIAGMALALSSCQATPRSTAAPDGAREPTAELAVGADATPEAGTDPVGGAADEWQEPAPAVRAHGHDHAAPRGGTLVELGDEFAHLEFVFDAHPGRLTAYVLDGEAERAVRIAQDAIVLRLDATGEAIRLEPVAGVLTGETVGDTSQFEAVAPALAGARHVVGVIDAVSVRGHEFRDLAVHVTAHPRP